MDRVRKLLAELFELPGTGRLRPMEGLRAVAVTLVFFVHFESLFGNWLAPHSAGARAADFLRDVGHVGVDLFFVLSGFLIYGAVISKRHFSYRDFMKRRLRRIYPMFAAIFALYLVLSFLMPAESKLPPGLLPALRFILENALLLPGMFDIRPIVPVAWSLSYEVFFYAVIPLLVAALGIRRMAPRARLWSFAWIALACLVASQLGFGHIQLVMFISGIFVYEATRAERRAARPSPSLLRAGALLALFTLPVVYLIQAGPELLGLGYTTQTAYLLRALWLAVALSIVTFVSVQREGPLPCALVFAPLRWLGNMSYSYFLIHALTLKALALLAHRLVHGHHAALHWAILPIAYFATLCSSAFLYAAVEKRIILAPASPETRLRPAPVQAVLQYASAGAAAAAQSA